MGCIALSLALAAAPADAPPTFQSGSVTWDGRARPRGRDLLQSEMLRVHNAARRDFGVAPLAWDASLAEDAGRWASALARGTPFAHARQTEQGENLFRGTRGAFALGMMAQLWVDERRWFRPGVFPAVVRDGPWQRVGHYTQIVWPSTRRFGCALASSTRQDFLVCRYSPAGNYFGVPIG